MLGERFGRRAANERDVPFAHRREHVERHAHVEPAVRARPFLLIERLDDVMVFGERLPQPIREHDLAVGEVADDLARVPFARRAPPFHAGRSERRRHLVEPPRRFLDHFERMTLAEMGGVRVQHADSLPVDPSKS